MVSARATKYERNIDGFDRISLWAILSLVRCVSLYVSYNRVHRSARALATQLWRRRARLSAIDSGKKYVSVHHLGSTRLLTEEIQPGFGISFLAGELLRQRRRGRAVATTAAIGAGGDQFAERQIVVTDFLVLTSPDPANAGALQTRRPGICRYVRNNPLKYTAFAHARRPSARLVGQQQSFERGDLPIADNCMRLTARGLIRGVNDLIPFPKRGCSRLFRSVASGVSWAWGNPWSACRNKSISRRTEHWAEPLPELVTAYG